MRAAIDHLETIFGEAIRSSLRIEAEMVMTDSKENYVPVDLGTLRSSGFVEPVEYDGGKFSVKLVYGGAAAPYALAVHEHPSEHSPPSWSGNVHFSPPGRGPKYLERPMLVAISGMERRIGDRLKSSMR